MIDYLIDYLIDRLFLFHRQVMTNNSYIVDEVVDIPFCILLSFIVVVIICINRFERKKFKELVNPLNTFNMNYVDPDDVL